MTAAAGPTLESRWNSRHPYTPDLEYEVLGHLRVLDETGAEVQLSAPKLPTLLALLLVNHGRPVSVDRIADSLWGEAPPRSAPNLVQGYTRDLRQRLGAEEVTTVPGGYRLDARPASVDAERFEELARARRYEEALALWHGAALEEWVEDPDDVGAAFDLSVYPLHGLVDQIFFQWAMGKSANAVMVVGGVGEHRLDLGELPAEHAGDDGELPAHAARVGLGEDGPDRGGDHVAVSGRDGVEDVATDTLRFKAYLGASG